MDRLSAYINFDNGDLISKNGIIQNINSIIMEALSRIFTPVGSWWLDQTFGSLLSQLMKKGKNNINANTIISTILDALQPMKNANLINGASCVVNGIIGFYVEFTVNIVDIDNTIYSLPLNYNGGTI